MAEKASWPVLPIREAVRPPVEDWPLRMVLTEDHNHFAADMIRWVDRLEKLVTYLDEEYEEVVNMPTCVFMELRELARGIRDAQADRA